MAASQAVRSRRLAQKAARRKVVVAEKRKAETSAGSLTGRIARAAASPLDCCLFSAAMFEEGMGYVIVARKLPTGTIAAAFFLVDTLGRGVKDTHYFEYERSDFDARVEHLSSVQDLDDIDPGRARALLRAAVAYARGLGIAPAKEYPALEAIFGDIEPSAEEDAFAFGKDGKPVFFEALDEL